MPRWFYGLMKKPAMKKNYITFYYLELIRLANKAVSQTALSQPVLRNCYPSWWHGDDWCDEVWCHHVQLSFYKLSFGRKHWVTVFIVEAVTDKYRLSHRATMSGCNLLLSFLVTVTIRQLSACQQSKSCSRISRCLYSVTLWPAVWPAIWC